MQINYTGVGFSDHAYWFKITALDDLVSWICYLKIFPATNCFLNHKIFWSLLYILCIKYQGHWYYISFYLVVLSKLTIINQNTQTCFIFRHFMVMSTYFNIIFYLVPQIQIILYFRNYFKFNYLKNIFIYFFFPKEGFNKIEYLL